MFSNIYKDKRVLITGHTGYKASWLALWLHRMGAIVSGISHAPHPPPTHYDIINLHDILEKDIHSDISLVDEINSLKPDIVFHLAARAIVANTFNEPEPTFQYTVMGAVHMLELCRQCPSVQGVVMATSDKVYLNNEWDYAYREIDTLGGDDPYSTSKVCVEHIVECYRKSFDMNIAVGRCGNVIGGGDFSDKRLIPDIAKATAKGEVVVIHTPNATRPFQHTLEALQGYLLLGKEILKGNDVNRCFNFGPTHEMTVLEVLEIAQARWKNVKFEVDNKPTHKFMVYKLKIDSVESRKLGWEPVWGMVPAVVETIEWYKAYFEKGLILTNKNIDDYEEEYGLHHRA